MARQFKPLAYVLTPWDGILRRLSNMWRVFQGLNPDSELGWQAHKTLEVCGVDARRAYFVISAYTAKHRSNEGIAEVLNPMMIDDGMPIYTDESIERACGELYEAGLIDRNRRPRSQMVIVEGE